MKTVANILGFLSFAASVVGIVLFFGKGADLIVWFALFSLLSSLVNVVWGDQNNLNTEILTIIIGAVISSFTALTLLSGISIALCVGDVVMQIIGYVALLSFALRSKSNQR